MHENAERDWLSELLQSDPEDPAIEKGEMPHDLCLYSAV